jgi:hypothetical protein
MADTQQPRGPDGGVEPPEPEKKVQVPPEPEKKVQVPPEPEKRRWWSRLIPKRRS